MASTKPSAEASEASEKLDAPALPTIDEDSPGPAADRTEEPPEEATETNVVRYLGIFAERGISKEEWETAGVQNQDGVMWTKATGNILPIDDFTDRALEVLVQTGEFQIVRDSE